MFKSMVFAGMMAATVSAQGGVTQMSHPRGEAALKAAALAAPKPPETMNEVLSAQNYLFTHLFELFDVNQDGALSPDEWLEYIFSSYAVYNKAKDGHLLSDEFAEFINGPTSHPFGVGRQPVSRIEAMFRNLDHGNKGYLAIEDFRDEAMKYFRANDVNRDGLVTPAEMQEVANRPRPR
jgi:Ca2+-binding EF-hand superfamily protein